MDKPEYLEGLAADAWDRIVSECSFRRVDCSNKLDVVERYAVTYSLWVGCCQGIENEGQTVLSTSENGTAYVRNPRMTDYHQFMGDIGKLRSELGLGPVSSAKQRQMEDAAPPKEVEAIQSRRKLRIVKTG